MHYFIGMCQFFSTVVERSFLRIITFFPFLLELFIFFTQQMQITVRYSEDLLLNRRIIKFY